LSEEELLSIASGNDFVVVALGINCNKSIELHRGEIITFGNFSEISWPVDEYAGLRVSSTAHANIGFIAFALCRKLKKEDKLKRIYLNSLNNDVPKFLESALDLNGFFKIPYLLECKDSIQTLKTKLLNGELFTLPEIVSDKETLTFCGIDGKRIANPVRGKRCKHFQCFDIEVVFNAKSSRCLKRDNVQCAKSRTGMAIPLHGNPQAILDLKLKNLAVIGNERLNGIKLRRFLRSLIYVYCC
jgi:hypothetical protein